MVSDQEAPLVSPVPKPRQAKQGLGLDYAGFGSTLILFGMPAAPGAEHQPSLKQRCRLRLGCARSPSTANSSAVPKRALAYPKMTVFHHTPPHIPQLCHFSCLGRTVLLSRREGTCLSPSCLSSPRVSPPYHSSAAATLGLVPSIQQLINKPAGACSTCRWGQTRFTQKASGSSQTTQAGAVANGKFRRFLGLPPICIIRKRGKRSHLYSTRFLQIPERMPMDRGWYPGLPTPKLLFLLLPFARMFPTLHCWLGFFL